MAIWVSGAFDANVGNNIFNAKLKISMSAQSVRISFSFTPKSWILIAVSRTPNP
jgi:hypothetical protein